MCREQLFYSFLVFSNELHMEGGTIWWSPKELLRKKLLQVWVLEKNGPIFQGSLPNYASLGVERVLYLPLGSAPQINYLIPLSK